MEEKEKSKNEDDSEEDEESGLEEEIESAEKTIDDTQFRESIQLPTESFSPVLEKIADVPEPVNLEQDVAPAQRETGTGERDYAVTSGEPEYSSARDEEARIENENLLIRTSAPINFETAGRVCQELRTVNITAPEFQGFGQTTRNSEEELYVKSGAKLDERRDIPPFGQTKREYKGKPI